MFSISDIRRTVRSRDTGYRVATMPKLGFSLTCADNADIRRTEVNVHTTELKLAVNYTLDGYADTRERDYRTDQMVKQLHDYIYGDIKHDLHKVINELRVEAGSHSPAATILFKILKDLDS